MMSEDIRSGQPLTLAAYLDTEETNRRRELIWGIVREPPAPTYGHQGLVGRLFALLDQHARRLGLGTVVVSPIDVILDADRDLVVQPDVVFVGANRRGIIRNQIWGAPDLVVEVLSPGSRRYDRRDKRNWYGQYGVREQWIVDPVALTIEVYDLVEGTSRAFDSQEVVRSLVLPRLRLRVSTAFSLAV